MKAFLTSLAEATKRLNFGIIVHNLTDSTTFSIKTGKVRESTIPGSLSIYLADDNCHCSYFSHGEKIVVIYFVRFLLKKQRLVVIVRDTKQRVRVNKFISALINSSYGKSADSNLAEEFLGNFEIEKKEYEQKLQKLSEDTAFEKIVWQREKDEFNTVIAELKSDLENYKVSGLWNKASEEDLTTALETVSKLSGVESKYDSLVREMWGLRNDLDDSRRENLALTGELSALKAYEAAETPDDKEKTLQDSITALKDENTALRRELKEYSEMMTLKDAQIKEQIEELSKQKPIDAAPRTDAIFESEANKIKQELEKQIEKQAAHCAELEKLNTALMEDFNKRGDLLEENRGELAEAQKELLHIRGDLKRLDALKEEVDNALTQAKADIQEQRDVYDRELSRLKAHISDIDAQNSDLAEEVRILKGLKSELFEILDGVVLPIFTIDENDKVIYANKALEAFRGAGGIIGDICHKAVHNRSERCEWCLAEQVRQNEEPVSVSVDSDFDGASSCLEITFVPVMDADGTLIKIAEIITDKTEVSELNESLSKTKEKFKELKVQKTEEFNKLNELNSAFQELTVEHKKIAIRNNKMVKVIERLVAEDKAKELLNARMELTEVRNKLIRANDMVKNYRYQLDEQLIKYSNLNKRTFMQIERLFNTVKGKASLRGEESVAVLSFLSREFERVRKQFIDEEKGLADRKETGEASFESVEEQILKEKFSAKMGEK
jgi:PAS domain-containing protein